MNSTLEQLLLPIDTLAENLYRSHQLDNIEQKYAKPHQFASPFRNMITLAFVKDERVKKAAREYIYKLLEDKKKLGFLYYLNNQKLVVQLDLNFNGELIIESNQYEKVIEEMDEIARAFACSGTSFYEITRIEILYFYTMLLNPHLNWIYIDYLLRCNRAHDHLIASPTRFLIKEENNWKKEQSKLYNKMLTGS
jgi:hypothetical protein